MVMKHEIEAALAQEAQAISSGKLKEDNPLDTSDNFRTFCEACRRGDQKVCQEMISLGVNINARDRFDYTPLILVSSLLTSTSTSSRTSFFRYAQLTIV
jgi:ankyrin repeat/BTB/POZ domain-containing protein 1